MSNKNNIINTQSIYVCVPGYMWRWLKEDALKGISKNKVVLTFRSLLCVHVALIL